MNIDWLSKLIDENFEGIDAYLEEQIRDGVNKVFEFGGDIDGEEQYIEKVAREITESFKRYVKDSLKSAVGNRVVREFKESIGRIRRGQNLALDREIEIVS